MSIPTLPLRWLPSFQRLPSQSRTVLITGASSGIGEALAVECARRGMNLGLVARRQENLERLADRLRAMGVQVEVAALDVRHTDEILPILQGLTDLLGGVDLVIANAGIHKTRKLGDEHLDRDKAVFETNVIGTIATSDAAITIFRRQQIDSHSPQRSGQIAVISSYSAFMSLPSSPAYSASKAALTSYFNGLRPRLKKVGIALTVIHPGFVKTDMLEGFKPRGLPLMARVDKVAEEMMDVILAQKANPVVPALPWGLIYGLQRCTPQRVLEEIRKYL